VHFALDMVGFIPIVGDVVDVLHGFWYLAEGRYGEMWLSFGSALPISGDIAFKGTKWTMKAARIGTRVAI
jgi:hypothetical protein